MLTQVLHFAPYLKSVIWGGKRIALFKGIDTDITSIGESWEISAVPGHISVVDRGPHKGKSITDLIREFGPELVGQDIYDRFGENFPLLIKLIDARDDLSVQVHPDDELALKRHCCYGKTEMWYIIDTAPNSRIHIGLKKPITPDEYQHRVANHSIMDVSRSYSSIAGDTYFLPAGCIHTIGAGNLLAEIQQTSDITYRIYDYGRRDKDGNTRQLHTEEARDAIDYTVNAHKLHPKDSLLIDCPYFVVNQYNVGQEAIKLPRTRDSFTIVMCLGGHAQLTCSTDEGNTNSQSIQITRGETLLFPATLRHITATGEANILSVQA